MPVARKARSTNTRQTRMLQGASQLKTCVGGAPGPASPYAPRERLHHTITRAQGEAHQKLEHDQYSRRTGSGHKGADYSTPRSPHELSPS